MDVEGVSPFTEILKKGIEIFGVDFEG